MAYELNFELKGWLGYETLKEIYVSMKGYPSNVIDW